MKIVVFCLAVSINILKFFELEQVEEKVSTKNLQLLHIIRKGDHTSES